MEHGAASTVFKVSELADSEDAFSEAVPTGHARLRGADGTNLAVLPEHELVALTEIVQIALRKPATDRSSADLGECEWLEVLDDQDLSTFLEELGVALLAAGRQHSADGLHQLVADWRVTAEVLADPEDRDILLGGYEDSDFVEVHRPE